MGWTAMGWVTVAGLFVMRVLLRQVRELLPDVGAVYPSVAGASSVGGIRDLPPEVVSD